MKKHLITLILVTLLTTQGYSQKYINTAFNTTHSGRNISISVSKKINSKHEIGGGLRININKIAHPDDQFNVFKKRLFATKPLHFFGIKGYYHYHVFDNLQLIRPFLFYDLQTTYSTTRNRMFLPYTQSPSGETLYRELIDYFGPFTWVEQTIGVGYKVKVFSDFYIQQKIGFGTSFILGYDQKLLDKYFEWFDWEFGGLINVGISYKIN